MSKRRRKKRPSQQSAVARGTTRSGPQAPQAGAAPALEMSFSESTDHWLAEGDTLSDAADGAAALHPASTRRRDMAVIGGAIVLGLALIWILRGHAGTNNPAVPAAVPGDVATAATVLTHRAESALADGKAERALDLARQAILADPWYADAYAVVGSAHRSAGRRDEARTAYRRYLDLAPNGRQAATVKAQLDRLDNGG
jgi:tetratricopeptide (TPR) repeat protein